ncbi:MAG: NAD(P)H-dependent oxidoreductase [Lysobacterales bacterium]
MAARLLVVYHSHGWRTAAMAEAVAAGAREAVGVEVILKRALQADLDDLLAAQAYLFGTPETFGSLSGALKDFFERTYYPAQGRTQGRAYASFVCAGNDGSGAIQAIQRIARGYGWKEVQPALLARSETVEASLPACRELGATLAHGLALGVY